MRRLELFPIGSVPPAGGRELVAYKENVAAHRSDISFFLSIAAVFGFFSFLPFMPAAIQLVYLFIVGASGLGATVSFVRLSRQSLWRALPEGMTTRTAELEDVLHKNVREWNAEATAWNARFDAWTADVALWKQLRLHPSEDDFEWTPQSIEDRRKSLASMETVLGLERLPLMQRRQEIQRELDRLITDIAVPDPIIDE